MLSGFIAENKPFIFAFLSALVLSLGLTPVVRLAALRLGLVSRPRSDRWHTVPTALFGGVAIFSASFLTFLFNPAVFSQAKGLLFGASFIFFWGVMDDMLGFQPYIKLLGQMTAASITIFFGVSSFPVIGNIFLAPLIILWIIGVTNAFNMLDNMDGLACGIAAIASLMLFVNSVFMQHTALAMIALVLAGASLGFLPYNFNPARIFMGDSGSMFLGFSLAMIAIMGTTGSLSNLIVTMAIPFLVMAVPIFDTTFVSLVRMFKGQSIAKGGKDHTSHRIVYLGLSVRKTVCLFYLISALLGLIALSYSRVNIFLTALLTVVAAIILLYFGFFLAEVRISGEGVVSSQRSRRPGSSMTVFDGMLLHKRRVVEVLLDFILICAAYYFAFFLRYEGNTSLINSLSMIKESWPFIILIKMSVFFMFGLYRGVWKYISISDLTNIFKAVSLGSVISIAALTLLFRFREYSRAVFFIDWLLLLFLASGTRVLFRLIGDFFDRARPRSINILIYGAGDTGEMALREIRRNRNLDYNPVCFIDDDPRKLNNKIHGVPVAGARDRLFEIIKARDIKEVIIAIPGLGPSDISHIAGICGEAGVEYRRLGGLLDKAGADAF
ncbi:MAG: hypothetical protein PHR44_06745 [Candidatus Omnitrophica bacterium]|nr:hypothetical protein [Candidatus Omnitrophota bacterium]